jgi:hypothetical protein
MLYGALNKPDLDKFDYLKALMKISKNDEVFIANAPFKKKKQCF